MRAEISYDLVMEEDMPFVEGTFRLPDEDWQVFIVLARSPRDREVFEPQVTPHQWANGVTGLVIRMLTAERTNAESVEKVLSSALSVSKWTRISGPDSMQLR